MLAGLCGDRRSEADKGVYGEQTTLRLKIIY